MRNLKPESYFKMSKILPSPKSWPVIGTLAALIASGGAEKLHKYVDNRHKELGPIYKEKIGPTEAIFISNPDYMRRIFAFEGRYPQHIIPDAWKLYNKLYGQKRGLLFMDGEEWHKYRKILNGIILKPETGKLTSGLTFVANDLTEIWGKGGAINDLELQLYTWSLRSILAVLVGEKFLKANETQLEGLINQLGNNVHNIFMESSKLSLFPVQVAQKLSLPVWKRFTESVNQSFHTANILLDYLNKPEADGLLTELRAAQLSDYDLNRIVIDLILAAGDTTAYTTQWLFYLLSIHETVQNDIYETVKNQSTESMAENPLLKGALRESLRLYPVAPFVTRYMQQTVDIDGFTVHKNDLVIMSLYSSGRDAASFPSPNEFQPSRWLRNANGYKNVKNPNGSLPFAMGARSCIGRKIAETQILITAGMVLKHFQIACLNRDQVDIKLNLITVPSVPILLNLSRR